MARGSITRAGCALALVVAALSAPAVAHAGSGHTVTPHIGHIGVQVKNKKTARAAISPFGSTAESTAPDISGQLSYHGGTIMKSNQVRAFYWFPPGYSLDPSWHDIVDGFLGNVAADSGKTSSVFSVTSQYGVGYSARFLGSDVDTHPFPASGCSEGLHGGPCLTEEQIFDELESFAKEKGWTADRNAVTGNAAEPAAHPTHLFVVYLPRGVADCFDGTGDTCSANSANPYYCAYHTAWYDDTQTFVWTNMPWSWDDTGCQGSTFPNGSATADTAVDVTSHEYIEALTDPYLDAWFDSGGYEIADKCQSSYGSAIGSDPTSYNQLIHGGHYWTQLEYSNRLADCYQLGAPAVSTLAPGQGIPGQVVQIGGQNFYGPVVVKFNGLVAEVQSVTPTAITVKVPAGDFGGRVTVQAIGGTGTSAASFTYPKPSVTSISPGDGKVGTAVTISGANFTGLTQLKFGSVPDPTATVVDDGTITAHVPVGFSSGRLALTGPGGTVATTQTFEVTKVTGMTPRTAKAGALIRVTGQGLASTTSVDFPDHPDATVAKATSSYVLVAVPADATGGAALVVHTPNIDAAGIATGTTFTAIPTVTTFTADGHAGTVVTIDGANLSDATTVRFGSIAAAATPDPSGTSVTAVVPAGFAQGRLTVVTPRGSVMTRTPFQLTTVTAFTPRAAAAGTVVTIAGHGLGSVTSVDFAGSPGAAVLTHAAGAVRVRLPADAQTGAITIHTPNIDAAGITTTIVMKPQPRITGFDATGYQVGDTVTVHGSNLAETGAYSAKLGPVALADLDVVDAGTLTFTVPATGLTSRLTFGNAAGTTTSSGVVRVRPTIDSVAPLDAEAGEKVTLTGAAFRGTTAVTFGGVKSQSFTVARDGNSVVAVVPTTAIDGPVAAANAGGSTSSAGSFHVDPVVKSLNPASGAVGTTITVTGTGLANVDQVDFAGGVSATPSSNSATWLKVVVPPGATGGPTAVHAGSLSATSTKPFAITFSVTSLSKAYAPAGATVQLNGIGLTGVTAVKFGDASAAITAQNGSSLTATVPALDGSVTLTVTKGSTTIQAPGTFGPMRVTAAYPGEVTAGGTILLHGDGLAGGTATFAGAATPVDLASSGGGYTADVPDGFTGGTVTITDSYGDSVDQSFGLFAVASYSASHAAPGESVSITLATAEDLTSATVKVKFAGVAAVTATGGNGVVTADVPDGATDGALQVSADGPGGGSSGWATGGDFTVDRAAVVLNEVAPGGSGAQIELLATADGGLGDTTVVWRANGTSHTIDLPEQTVQAGDLVVVDTGISAGGEVTIEVKTPLDVEDGLALNDGGTPSSGFVDDVASLQSDGAWGSSDSFDWSTLTAGQSVSRTDSATPDDVANWSAADASIGSSN